MDSGFIAEEIDKFCKNNYFIDTSGVKHNGLLNGNDLSSWSASEESKIFKYENYEIFKTDFWVKVQLSSTTIDLKNFNLSDYNEYSPEFVHIVTEATKLAFADRGILWGSRFCRNTKILFVRIIIKKEQN